jgi:hypothetical protein
MGRLEVKNAFGQLRISSGGGWRIVELRLFLASWLNTPNLNNLPPVAPVRG